jgi:hypothetical protein
MSPLEKLDALDRTKQSAFLGLFAGASGQWHTRSDTDAMPFTGKHECQQVEPWRDFWQRELVDLGFITFEESEPFPTPGAIFDSSTIITIGVTDEGRAAREAYWDRVNDRPKEQGMTLQQDESGEVNWHLEEDDKGNVIIITDSPNLGPRDEVLSRFADFFGDEGVEMPQGFVRPEKMG